MPRGLKDPERPARIAQAAFDVVADAGVARLSHRAVAAAADVPLGSTTYHYAALDDLLVAAMTAAKARHDAELEAWSESLGPDPDLAAELTRFVVAGTAPARRRLATVELELYVAAVRRPALRELSVSWERAVARVLSRYADELTVEALAAASEGLVLQALVRNSALTWEEVEPVLRRVLGD